MKKQLILPCIRSAMGDWIIYSSSMSIKELSERVITDKKYREDDDLDNVLQRDLKDRKIRIAKYLETNPSRFFNSIIIGVFNSIPQWHEFEIFDKIKELAGEEAADDYSHTVGLLQFLGDEEMFAVDGQHRVAGMQIAYGAEMLKEPQKRVLTEDKFPVIFIAHIDDLLGKKRTRKLFSDINKNAQAVSAGDQIKMDEESLTAIVTRRLYAQYEHFKGKKIISLTEQEKLDRSDTTHFTNLLGLNNTIKVLKKLYKKTPGTLDWDEANVQMLYKISTDFYDFIIEHIHDYQTFFNTDTFDLKTARDQNQNLYFRPVGLKVLAGIYVHFHKKANGIKLLSKKIAKLSFQMPDSPFNNILWYNGKMKARESNQTLATELGIYLLDNLPDVRKNKLLENYRQTIEQPRAKLPKRLS